jgi:lipopolysaccharide transport protein LptA
MKHFSIIIIAVWCGWMVHAQTDATTQSSPASATTNSPDATPPPRAPTRIDSDSVDFDLTKHEATYRGHVHVDDPQMKLSSEQLVADLPEAGGRPSRIVAETNVVIDFTDTKGQTNHATSDKAVYIYNVQNGVTNETVTFTGNAKIENAQGTLTGEPIFWDRVNNHLRADNQKMILRQNLNSAPADTNSPPVKTNFPPGTIENVDKNISNQVNSPPPF